MAMPRGPSVADAALLITVGSNPLTSEARPITIDPPGSGAGPVFAVVDVATTFTIGAWEFGVVFLTVVPVVARRGAVVAALAAIDVDAPEAVDVEDPVSPKTVLAVTSL